MCDIYRWTYSYHTSLERHTMPTQLGPLIFGMQEKLRFTVLPPGATSSLLNAPMSGSTLTVSGSYSTTWDVRGYNNVVVDIRFSTGSGVASAKPTLAILSCYQTEDIASVTGSLFNGTFQTMSISGLYGAQYVRFAFNHATNSWGLSCSLADIRASKY